MRQKLPAEGTSLQRLSTGTGQRAKLKGAIIMFDRLRQPKGALGILSVIVTLFLAITGVAGVFSTLIPPVADRLEFGDDRWPVATLFALMIVGAIGFLIMDRRPWPGVALAILGSIATALIGSWTIVPIVVGIIFTVVAVMRAMAFDRHAAHA
jgi:hypothetical protein